MLSYREAVYQCLERFWGHYRLTAAATRRCRAFACFRSFNFTGVSETLAVCQKSCPSRKVWGCELTLLDQPA